MTQMMLVHLNVNQYRIDHGCRQSNTLCPVALAAQAVFPRNKVSVGSSHIRINCKIKHGFMVYSTDIANITFPFDVGKPVEPRIITIEVPADLPLLPIINNLVQ